jgi:2-keto-3-deoxy-galactonokinase
MPDRLAEIRARLADGEQITLTGPPALVAAFVQKDEDIAWLLEAVETERAQKERMLKSLTQAQRSSEEIQRITKELHSPPTKVTWVNDGRKY